MKSKSKTSRSFKMLGYLICCLVLTLGIILGCSARALAAEAEEPQAPTIVSVGGIAIGSSGIGNFPSAIVGQEYKDTDGNNYKIVATGTGPLTYTAHEYNTGSYGEMPEGLHLNSKTGEFSGTITSAGTFGVSITVSNEYGSTNVLCYISVYNESDKPTITTESLPNGAVGSSYYQEINFNGYYADGVRCEVISGSLPAGLNIGRVGIIRPTVFGTPTETGSFTFTLSINNGAGTATKEYTIEITEEAIRPSLIMSASTVSESDKYSSIDSHGYIHVVKGKPVSIQLAASGTNTTDNPIKFELYGTRGILPDGLTMSDTGLITGTLSNDIGTSSGQKTIATQIKVANKTVGGSPQSSSTDVWFVVHDNGHAERVDLNPQTTSVAKGGTRQFEIDWTAYGDVDKSDVTWRFYNGTPSSESTTISNTGFLTVGIDETRTQLKIQVKHNVSEITRIATVTIVDHTHTTTLVNAVDKTCTTDGNIKHYKCTLCDELFEDALATKTLSADKVKIPASHEYGTIISKVPATCSSTGKEAYYECSDCHNLFNSSKVETTEAALVIAKDETAHKLGTLKVEIPATCAGTGTKAHKICEYCHKHFDSDGVEITDLTIAKNDNHQAKTDVWQKDGSGHWHACTRDGCKDGGKVDFASHTPSATEATETTNIHCTECGYIIEAVKDHTHGLKIVAGRSYTCNSDGAKTYYVCSEGENPCNRYFEDADGKTEITEDINKWKVIPASHTFGEWTNKTEPTCGTTGELAHKTCSVCKYHFDDKGEKINDIIIPKNDDHIVPDTKTLESDQYGHWHACTRDGCKNNGKADYVEHTNSAAMATETNDVHCTVCGFIIEARVGHVHELSKVEGYAETCTADGAKTYYVCSGGDHPCGKYFEDENGETEISASRLNAWKTISAHHTFGDWIEEVAPTDDDFGVKAHKDCTVCGKHFDADDIEIEELKIDKLTSPDTPDTPTTPDEPKGSLTGGAIAAIAIGSTALVGTGGFSLFWFVIKKKKFSDLIAVFSKK